MNQVFYALAVLAQGDYTDMGRRFRKGGPGIDSSEFVLFILVLLALALVVTLVARYFTSRQERGFCSQRALFSELCRAHGLNWTRRRLLKRLAEQHQVSPCQLFLEPARFSKEHCQGALAKYAAEVAALKEELF